MNHEPDRKLEDLLHRELRQLPPLKAPADLIARVQLAIASQRSLPWWAQSWFAWPRLAQFGSAACAMLLLSGLAWLLSGSWLDISLLGESSGTLTALSGTLNALLQFLASAAGVSLSVFLAVGAGLLVTMYLGCIGLGTLFYRVAAHPR